MSDLKVLIFDLSVFSIDTSIEPPQLDNAEMILSLLHYAMLKEIEIDVIWKKGQEDKARPLNQLLRQNHIEVNFVKEQPTSEGVDSFATTANTIISIYPGTANSRIKLKLSEILVINTSHTSFELGHTVDRSSSDLIGPSPSGLARPSPSTNETNNRLSSIVVSAQSPLACWDEIARRLHFPEIIAAEHNNPSSNTSSEQEWQAITAFFTARSKFQHTPQKKPALTSDSRESTTTPASNSKLKKRAKNFYKKGSAIDELIQEILAFYLVQNPSEESIWKLDAQGSWQLDWNELQKKLRQKNNQGLGKSIDSDYVQQEINRALLGSNQPAQANQQQTIIEALNNLYSAYCNGNRSQYINRNVHKATIWCAIKAVHPLLSAEQRIEGIIQLAKHYIEILHDKEKGLAYLQLAFQNLIQIPNWHNTAINTDIIPLLVQFIKDVANQKQSNQEHKQKLLLAWLKDICFQANISTQSAHPLMNLYHELLGERPDARSQLEFLRETLYVATNVGRVDSPSSESRAAFIQEIAAAYGPSRLQKHLPAFMHSSLKKGSKKVSSIPEIPQLQELWLSLCLDVNNVATLFRLAEIYRIGIQNVLAANEEIAKRLYQCICNIEIQPDDLHFDFYQRIQLQSKKYLIDIYTHNAAHCERHQLLIELALQGYFEGRQTIEDNAALKVLAPTDNEIRSYVPGIATAEQDEIADSWSALDVNGTHQKLYEVALKYIDTIPPTDAAQIDLAYKHATTILETVLTNLDECENSYDPNFGTKLSCLYRLAQLYLIGGRGINQNIERALLLLEELVTFNVDSLSIEAAEILLALYETEKINLDEIVIAENLPDSSNPIDKAQFQFRQIAARKQRKHQLIRVAEILYNDLHIKRINFTGTLVHPKLIPYLHQLQQAANYVQNVPCENLDSVKASLGSFLQNNDQLRSQQPDKSTTTDNASSAPRPGIKKLSETEIASIRGLTEQRAQLITQNQQTAEPESNDLQTHPLLLLIDEIEQEYLAIIDEPNPATMEKKLDILERKISALIQLFYAERLEQLDSAIEDKADLLATLIKEIEEFKKYWTANIAELRKKHEANSKVYIPQKPLSSQPIIEILSRQELARKISTDPEYQRLLLSSQIGAANRVDALVALNKIQDPSITTDTRNDDRKQYYLSALEQLKLLIRSQQVKLVETIDENISEQQEIEAHKQRLQFARFCIAQFFRANRLSLNDPNLRVELARFLVSAPPVVILSLRKEFSGKQEELEHFISQIIEEETAITIEQTTESSATVNIERSHAHQPNDSSPLLDDDTSSSSSSHSSQYGSVDIDEPVAIAQIAGLILRVRLETTVNAQPTPAQTQEQIEQLQQLLNETPSETLADLQAEQEANTQDAETLRILCEILREYGDGQWGICIRDDKLKGVAGRFIPFSSEYLIELYKQGYIKPLSLWDKHQRIIKWGGYGILALPLLLALISYFPASTIPPTTDLADYPKFDTQNITDATENIVGGTIGKFMGAFAAAHNTALKNFQDQAALNDDLQTYNSVLLYLFILYIIATLTLTLKDQVWERLFHKKNIFTAQAPANQKDAAVVTIKNEQWHVEKSSAVHNVLFPEQPPFDWAKTAVIYDYDPQKNLIAQQAMLRAAEQARTIEHSASQVPPVAARSAPPPMVVPSVLPPPPVALASSIDGADVIIQSGLKDDYASSGSHSSSEDLSDVVGDATHSERLVYTSAPGSDSTASTTSGSSAQTAATSTASAAATLLASAAVSAQAATATTTTTSATAQAHSLSIDDAKGKLGKGILSGQSDHANPLLAGTTLKTAATYLPEALTPQLPSDAQPAKTGEPAKQNPTEQPEAESLNNELLAVFKALHLLPKTGHKLGAFHSKEKVEARAAVRKATGAPGRFFPVTSTTTASATTTITAGANPSSPARAATSSGAAVPRRPAAPG